MQILLIVSYYLPNKKSSAILIHDLATELNNQGHKIIVLAPDQSLTEFCQITTEENITVVRVRSGKIDGAGKIQRAWNEIRLSSTLWKYGKSFFRENPCDLIVFYSPSIFFGGLVHRLKSLWKCKAYLILRDIFPQWVIDSGILKEGFIARYFRYKERYQYTVADVIGVQSPGNLEYFEQNLVQFLPKLEVLYNWATLEKRGVVHINFRKKYGLENKLIFLYGGNIGVAQHMDSIVQLAENLRSFSEVYFLMVGDGSEVARLQKRIATRSLSNISIQPPVEQDEYQALLSQVDVGLISLDKNLKTHNFPGKMLGYMYYSIPILASINPGNDLQNIIEEFHAGMVCICGEDEILLEFARKMIQDTALRRDMGRNSRRLIENKFSVEQAANQILSSHSCEVFVS